MSRVRTKVMGYVALTKPRLIELLLVTTVPAMMLAPAAGRRWRLLVATLVGGTLAAGAANIFNCYYDRDIDRLMSRTPNRRSRSGWSAPRGADLRHLLKRRLVVLLAALTPPLAAALAAGAIFYSRPVHGGAQAPHPPAAPSSAGCPGAAPVLIGWGAVTGSLAWPIDLFFGIVFCWQMPHFWALASRFPLRLLPGPACRCSRWWPARCRCAGSPSAGPGRTLGVSLTMGPASAE